MNFPFYIARRYLFSKKSHNAINIVSLVSVCGVVVATIALVCALSVYNGFSDLIASLFSNFDPDLKILPKTGKVFDPNSAEIRKVKTLSDIAIVSEVVQDNALIRYHDRQVVATLKGVDNQYERLTKIDSILEDGKFKLREDVDYASFGIGLAASLGVNAGFVYPIEIYVPIRDKSVNMANPASSFNLQYAFISSVFCTNQAAYDENYMIVSLPLARTLFGYEKEISALEIKVAPHVSVSSAEKHIKAITGENYVVQNRYEQQSDSFRMMQIEKWMTFLILSFILLIALFNVTGSLSMLMIEKRDDVSTLRSLGANDKLIRQIFLFEGWMISAAGAIVGTLIGVVLCQLQQQFGFIKLGDASGSFIIDAYPVRVVLSDVLLVLVTVLIMGLLAAWYPVRYFGRKWLTERREE